MRVTFLVPSLDNGGGARVVAHYAQGLIQNGHTVLVVCPAPAPYGRLNKLRNFLRFRVDQKPSNHFDRLGVPVKMLTRYRAVKKSDVPDADVIVATWWETVTWLKKLPLSKGRPVHFVQDYEIWNGRKEEVEAALMAPIPKITISRWLSSIIEGLGLPKPDIYPNGIDHNQFSSLTRNYPERPTVGFVYSDNTRKGADIAVKAIKIAQLKRPDIKILIFGHSSPSRPIQIENLTYFVSPGQDELREIYCSCTVWLFPSREEGFGLPILEALACGTPVIAFPAGAAPEILASGGGTLLTSFEADEMANEILKYVSKGEGEWNKLSLNANIVSNQFQWNDSIIKFEKKLYEICLY